MPSTSRQDIELVLEKIRQMPLPEDEHVFSLRLHEEGNGWRVRGVVGPFAHTVADGHPIPSLCMLPLSDLEFSSEKQALDFAHEIHDILLERGKGPDGPTFHLLGNTESN